MSEGASFQQAAGYGAVKGAISGALSAGLTYAGGTFASRGADSIVSKAGNSIGDAVLAKTGSANLSAFANSASKFIIRVAGDAGEAAVLTAIEPAFQQIYNENAWYNAYGTDENRKAYAEQIGRSALTAAAFSAVTNAVRDVWQVHKAGGREAYMEQYERGAYQRLSENEILNSLSRADRRMAREGAAEWQKIQSEIDRVQSEYEAMKAKGASDVDLELFVGKNKEAISKQVGSFSDKYGKLFTKLSAKAHPDALPSTDNAKLAEARSATFQRYSSMTNKGAKEQLSQLFNGKNGIVGLIAYTSGSAPVETIKENDSLVARPKNFEQVQSVLAAAAEDGANAPAVLELPLKNGNNVRLDISVIAPKQLEGIAFLSDSDFKTLPDGNRVADLGDRKSFVISKDGTRVMVLNSSEIDDFDHLTKAITLPDGSKASLVEYVDGLVKSDRSLEFSVEENESGKYLKYGGQGLNGFSQEDKVRILKMYLTKKYQNTEIALDGDSISVTRQSVKKLGKFSGQNLDKAYLELKELGEIAKFDKRVPNMKNKELNAPPYSYYVAKMEIDGSIVNFQFNIRESFDRSPILYAIQEIKNGGVVPGNNSSLAPSTMPVSGGSNSGSALAPATNNIPNAKKDVKSGSKEDSTFVGLAITHDETISLSDYDEKMSIYKPIVKDVIDRLNAIDGDTVSLDEAIGGYTFSSEDALSGYSLGGEPSFPLQIDTGDFAEDAIRAFAIGDLAFEIQDTIMVGHFDPAGKNRVFGISLTRVDEGLEDIIAKFKWEGYTLDVKGKSISFVDPDEEQLRTFLIQLIENGYAKPETAKTTADAANVQFAGRSDRLDAYETWLQSHDREQDGELFRFVREAYERLKGSLSGSGQSAAEDTKASSGAKGASLARFRANPSLVKQAANAKVGKVYSLSSVKAMVNAVEDAIQDALSLDNLGGKTAMNIKKGEIAKAFFDTLNLGTQEQKAGLLSILRDKLLGTKVKYKLDDFYGETLDSYEGTLKEFLAVLDEGERAELDAGISKLFRDLEGGGSDSDMKKVIDAFSEKLSALADKYRSLKASTKITGHIEKHRAKMVQRYYHGDVEDFAPGFDFDNQGFRVLVQPLHDFALTAGKQSYTGSSVVKALSNFLDGYKPENFQKADVPVSGDVSMTSQLYNQGLRDLANAIVESIEADNKHVLGNGKVRYDALDARQLAMLRLFQDTIEKMPAQFTKDRLEAVANAQAGYHGVERYVSTVLKGENVGLVRKFIQGYAERYGNQLDTLIYEIGDNVLSRAIVDELYLSQAQAMGMRDEFQGKISNLRKTHRVTSKALDAKSSKFKDTAGKPVEMKYLETVYRHLLSGEESNNVKYIEANTVYAVNKKGGDRAHNQVRVFRFGGH